MAAGRGGGKGGGRGGCSGDWYVVSVFFCLCGEGQGTKVFVHDTEMVGGGLARGDRAQAV